MATTISAQSLSDHQKHLATIAALEPHRADLNDNLQKARGMADYSKRCSVVKWNELIRLVEKNGNKELLRLDLTDGLVANELNSINTDDELTNLFAKFNIFRGKNSF